MRRGRRKILTLAALAVVCLLCLNFHSAAQPQASPLPVPGNAGVTPKPEDVKLDDAPSNSRAAIRIRVKDADGKPLTRKRFYLLQKDINTAGVNFAARPRREDFLEGASPELRAWLARHDCDTLYCPEYEAEYERAVQDVPEFRKALDDGLRKYRSRELALRWLTINFPLKDARAEYYRRKRAWLEEAARRAGTVGSVMTDEKGAAFFLGVKPGPYFVSNLLPSDDGGVLWDCALDVPPPVPKQLHSVSLDLSHAKKQ